MVTVKRRRHIKSPKGSVLIVGAGIAGLSLAWCLQQQGWHVLVIEKSENLSSNGYMLSLSGPGYEVARRMGMIDELKKYDRQFNENCYRNIHGKEILRLKYRKLAGTLEWVTLTRSELAMALYQHVEQRVDIRFSTTLSSYHESESGITAYLSDGSVYQADLLIGAAGARSKLRTLLFGDDSSHMQQLGYRVAAFDAPNDVQLDKDFVSYAGPGHLSEFYALSKQRLATLFIWRSNREGYIADHQQRKKILYDTFKGSHPEAYRLIENLSEDQPLYFDDMVMTCLPRWSKGRVLLMGDAAHCLTLVSGQGAGISIASAYLLAQQLANHDIDTALKKHEALLKPVILRLQDRSRKVAKWFIPATTLGFHLRNMLMQCLPSSVLGWYLFKATKSDIFAATEGLGIHHETQQKPH